LVEKKKGLGNTTTTITPNQTATNSLQNRQKKFFFDRKLFAEIHKTFHQSVNQPVSREEHNNSE
jgi:hypothetical protein